MPCRTVCPSLGSTFPYKSQWVAHPVTSLSSQTSRGVYIGEVRFSDEPIPTDSTTEPPGPDGIPTTTTQTDVPTEYIVYKQVTSLTTAT